MQVFPGKNVRWIALAAGWLLGSTAFAQNPLIRVGTEHTQLVLSVDGKKQLTQVYFGKAMTAAPTGDGTPAYPAYGTDISDAALRITHADGNLTTRLVYSRHTEMVVDANSTLTTIYLKDSHYPDEVRICYKTYRKQDVIEQWTEIEHTEKSAITLHNYASAALGFRSAPYFLSYFYGDWANEFNLVETELTEGTKIVDSKLTVRSNQMSNPSFLLSVNGKLQEDTGEVVGGTLAWPGNWQFRFELDRTKKLQLTAGANPFAAEYKLAPKTVFKTPSFLYTWSDGGSGEVSRRFHRWARTYGLRDGQASRDILLNNWEATYFDFDETKLSAIIKDAASMGFELFLLDDGWFGTKYPRNNDDAGLGDWTVNPKKLPHGLSYLAEECRKRNLKFGIWVEPEMVNPKSELYEKHPEWVLTAANRELDLQRNQLILDLTNPAVQEYVYSVLEKTVTENKGISYLKWDCNRYLTNPGSSYLGADKQSHLFVEYSRGLMKVLERFRKKFPDITAMVCSGGGGRMDYGTMPYFQEYWSSDNTDALDRIRIQWGVTHFFPAIGLASHVSVTPNHITGRATPLKFRFDVAMSGKLGMDLQPGQMSPDEKAFSQKAIQTYKQIRGTVLHGDLYRLQSPYTHDRAAISYVSERQDSVVVFHYLLKKAIYGDKSTVRLKGLKKDGVYKLTEINKGSFTRLGDYEGKTFTGEFLMTQGLPFTLYNEFESAAFVLSLQ
ncbi:alpha-galactosidase [Siphonobacter aquaeclarae]|uniref:Alpha-galactosidase n=1 Tax=Siphonobacter aquaeclarae TaxID=563176 RepID=A0A1G9PE38_9BACT|nr:alpha-galactosidase [Siphonobacter aquaeclarae]SDL97086.1 alpha-galactosidase [Siphonobacter aquaeclarae]